MLKSYDSHYRTPPPQYQGTFPAAVGFYRDTYGLEPAQDSRFIDSYTTSTTNSVETETTKSTVKNVKFNTGSIMVQSQTSQIPEYGTPMTQSFQIDQVVTTEVIVRHPRSLFLLACLQLVVSIQLVVFGLITFFYGGAPYFVSLWSGGLFILNAGLGLLFLKMYPKRCLLILYLLTTILCFLHTFVLFGWTVVLIEREDNDLKRQGWHYKSDSDMFKLNKIVTNTKLAMYSLQMILAPIHAICCFVSAVLLTKNVCDMKEGRVSRAYFFSQAPMGHQKVLVPIELKQVKHMPPTNGHPTMASIGVQAVVPDY